MKPSASLITEVTANIAIVRFDRPLQRNSLSIATLTELDQTVSSLLGLQQITSLIFTGTGDVFASGADLTELSNLDSSAALEFARLGQKVFRNISEAEVLTIAAINGFCMGGGLDLALSCDVRVASRSAMFAHPGAKRGIITGWGGTKRLPQIVGRSRSLELFCTARMVRMEEALLMGLVTSTGDPVLELALDLARRSTTKFLNQRTASR